MTKSELRTGMIVTNAIGEHMMVLKEVFTFNFNGDCFVQVGDAEEWDDMDSYNEDLTHKYPSLSIVKVSIPEQPATLFTNPLHHMRTLWERKD